MRGLCTLSVVVPSIQFRDEWRFARPGTRVAGENGDLARGRRAALVRGRWFGRWLDSPVSGLRDGGAESNVQDVANPLFLDRKRNPGRRVYLGFYPRSAPPSLVVAAPSQSIAAELPDRARK